MGDWKISKSYSNSQVQSGEVDPIDVLEDAVEGWVFDYAERLTDAQGEEHGGLAVLMLAASQVEQLERYWTGDAGKDRPGEIFRLGLKRVFGLDDADEVANLLYTNLRCGLFHMGLLRGQIGISYEPDEPLTSTGSGTQIGVVVNPRLFLEALRKDFSAFVAEVREGSSPARGNFSKVFPATYGGGGKSVTHVWNAIGTASPSSR